jgi:hypothetical protein
LRVEVDDEDFLAPTHGQAVGQHHGYGGFANAAPAIGDGDYFSHEGSPKLRDPIAALFAIGVCCTGYQATENNGQKSTVFSRSGRDGQAAWADDRWTGRFAPI